MVLVDWRNIFSTEGFRIDVKSFLRCALGSIYNDVFNYHIYIFCGVVNMACKVEIIFVS